MAANPKKIKNQAQKLIQLSLNSNTGYNLIESLTTEVGPRLAGSKAEALARAWAAKNMKSLGFQNVRIETFSVKRWERISESAKILSPVPQPLKITALGGSVGTPRQGLKGQVIRFSKFTDLVNAPLKGLKGKIVFVDEPMARTKDGSGYGVAMFT